MSGLTRAQLQALSPGTSLNALADALRARAKQLEPQESQFAAKLRYPGGGEEWTGQASDALQVRGQSVGRAVAGFDGALSTTAYHCEQAAGHLDTAVTVVRSKMADAEGDVIGVEADGRYWHCGRPFVVGDDLAVRVNPAQVESGAPGVVYETLGQLAHEHQEQISAAVRQLQEVSDDWKGRIAGAMNLDQLARNSNGQPYAPYDPGNTIAQRADAIANGTMDVPSDPVQLRELWQQLDKDQKEAIYERCHDIGNHGGIPFDPPDKLGRDTYNQRHLGEIETDKQRQLDDLLARKPVWNPQGDKTFEQYQEDQHNWQSKYDVLQHEVNGYKNVRATLDRGGKDGSNRYLEHIDDKGLAAVAVNNPDNAKIAGVLVPGTTADTTQMTRYDDHSKKILNSAIQAADGALRPEQVSVSTWMGYDRPMSVFDPFSDKWAGETKFALEGAANLDRFMDGIRASHNDYAAGGPSLNTVIGHSYGTSEVGAAATHGNHLDAHNVVLLASPGAFADNAGGLSLGGDAKVFVGKSDWDPINVANFGAFIGASDLGPDPADWKDAYRFDAGTGDHSSYFDATNPAMKNLGHILVGEDGSSGVTPY